MLNLSNNESLTFMHIPKTGGTTLHNILVQHFNKREICPERFNDLRKYDKNKLSIYKFFSGHYDRANVEYIPQKNKVITVLREPKSRIISLYYFWRAHKKEVIEKADLGGPRIAKKLSLLNFLKCRQGTIPLHLNNAQVRSMLGEAYIGSKDEYLVPKEETLEKAINYLDSLFAFGILENYDESIRYLCELINIECPEVIPRARDHKDLSQQHNLETIEREEITPEIDAELERLTELDIQLYEYAKNKLNNILIDKAREEKLNKKIKLNDKEEAKKYLEQGNSLLNKSQLKNLINNYHQALKLDPSLLENINHLFKQYYENLIQRKSSKLLNNNLHCNVKFKSLNDDLNDGICLVNFNNESNTITYQVDANFLEFHHIDLTKHKIKHPKNIKKSLKRLIETHTWLFVTFLNSFSDIKGNIVFDWRDKGDLEETIQRNFLCFY